MPDTREGQTLSLEADVDVSDLKNLGKDANDVMDKALNYLTQDLLAKSVKEAPKDTGNLQTSIDMRKLQHLFYGIGSDVFYRWWVHDGTGVYGPHGTPITPTEKKFMKFYWDVTGRIHFEREVMGQQGNNYYERAIEQVEDRMQEYMDKAIREIVG